MIEEIYISDEEIEKDKNNKIIGNILVYNSTIYKIIRADSKGIYIIKK